MNYLSTRGHPGRKSFCEILLEGLAPDGGLYLPERYPQVDANKLAALRAAYAGGAVGGYAALAFEILSMYIDDIPAADLRALCDKTYTEAVFGSAAIVPLKKLDMHPAQQERMSTSKPCPTAQRWLLKTWPCSSWATCLSTSWPGAAKS